MSGKSVTILGTGNVARLMGKTLSDKGQEIVEVWGRDPQKANKLAKLLGSTHCEDIWQLKQHDGLYLIAVSDSAIQEVVKLMPKVKGVVAHTSGTAPLEWLSDKFPNAGVLYPLQTIHNDAAAENTDIVLIIEANSDESFNLLVEVANHISTMQMYAEDDQRKKMHLAAVIINNFTNHLIALAKDYLNDNGLDLYFLHPLIEQTAKNAIFHDSGKIQTGPARRGDHNTIESHLDLIREQKNSYLEEIYLMLTASIQAYYRLGK